MVSKIKSAWTGQQIPQQDNRSKSAAPQAGVSNTVLPASQSGSRPFGPGEAPVTGAASNSYIQQYGQSTMDNVVRQQMGGSGNPYAGGGMPNAPQTWAASTEPTSSPWGPASANPAAQASSQPGTTFTVPTQNKQQTAGPSATPQATRAFQHEDETIVGYVAEGAIPSKHKYWNDQARVGAAFGLAGKPRDTVKQADEEVMGMYGSIGNQAQTEAERKAYEILATPTADQAYWDAKAAAQTAEIDRQSAMLQRQLQQQVAAGGGGIGGVQIQNMAEIAAQANRAKSEALTSLAKEKAYYMLEDKKTVVSLLFQGASLEQQTKLALLQAKMEQEAKNIDFGWTALSAAADFDEKGYDPTTHPAGDQINAAFQTDGTFRDPYTGILWRQGPDGTWYQVSYTTDPKGRVY